MSANDRQDDPAFNSIEEELEYYKKNYRASKHKISQLIACLNEDPDEVERLPPVKRQKMNSQLDVEDSMDPLKLPEPCVRHILSYLTLKEQIDVMSVSKTWCNYIASIKSFMDRIVYKPKLTKYQGELTAVSYCNDKIIRRYKHMKAQVGLINFNNMLYNPIATHSLWLETLEIMSSEYDDSFNWLLEIASGKRIEKSLKFPMLRNLTCCATILATDYFKNSSFPELTRLTINKQSSRKMIQSSEQVLKLLFLMPKLEVLFLNVPIRGNCRYHRINTSKIEGKAPQIKAIHTADYMHPFINFFRESLEKLEVESIKDDEIHPLLANLKNLKSLTFSRLPYRVTSYDWPQNHSIETFKFDILPYKDKDQCVRGLLMALPLLKKLILSYSTLTEERLKIIANTSIQLKQLYCRGITQNMREVYLEIQKKKHIYKNAAFELVEG